MRGGIGSAVAVVTLLLALVPPAAAVDTGGARLVDADTFFGQYASALDTFSRLESFISMHERLQRRLSFDLFASTPLVRSLAATNYGLLDVTPAMTYGAILLDAVRAERFSWLTLFSSGVSQLSPYAQPAPEGEATLVFSPIFKAQILLLNDLAIGQNLRFRVGWEHWEESERDSSLLLIHPGERAISYRINPLEDRFLLTTDLWRFLVDVVVRQGLDTLGVGRAWNVPGLDRLFTGLSFDRIASLATLGPRIDMRYGPLRLDARGGCVFSGSAGAIPLMASTAVSAAHDLTLFRRWGGFLGIPLYASANGSYRGQEEPGERWALGWKMRAGLVLKPPRGALPWYLLNVAFHAVLSVSRNDPEDLIVMPERDAIITAVDFGFHFL